MKPSYGTVRQRIPQIDTLNNPKNIIAFPLESKFNPRDCGPLKRTMLKKNGWVQDASFTLNRTSICECSSYVLLDREVNIMNNFASEMGRRKQAAWRACESIEDVVKKSRNTRTQAHLFNSMVISVLNYTSEVWMYINRMRMRSASSKAL